MPDLTKEEVIKIIEDYDDLIARTLQVVSVPPHYMSVDGDDLPRLAVVGTEIFVQWREYESDYYGGGYCQTAENSFPIEAILMTEDELKAMQKAVADETREREKKEQAARLARDRVNQEAHERAVLAALKAKYETPK